MASPPQARPALRALNAVFYGAFAALGFGLCARPAVLAARGLGLFGPVLPWEVPLGWLFLGLALLIAFFAVRLMLAAALALRVRTPERAAFLAAVAMALALRGAASEPSPRDPAPALLDGLRQAAAIADAGYARAGRYPPEPAALEAALAALPAPGFVERGRALPLRARVLDGAPGAQLTALPGDGPGTLYLAVSRDGSRCWLTALSLAAGAPAALTSAGRPLVLHAHAGTHSAPGRDPAVPEYPSMRPVHERAR